LKAFCETNGISMSQFVERRVGDFLGRSVESEVLPVEREAPQPEQETVLVASSPPVSTPRLPEPARHPPVPARRTAPEKPLLKDPDQKLTADQIFTF